MRCFAHSHAECACEETIPNPSTTLPRLLAVVPYLMTPQGDQIAKFGAKSGWTGSILSGFGLECAYQLRGVSQVLCYRGNATIQHDSKGPVDRLWKFRELTRLLR